MWSPSDIFIPSNLQYLHNIYGVTECTVYQVPSSLILSDVARCCLMLSDVVQWYPMWHYVSFHLHLIACTPFLISRLNLHSISIQSPFNLQTAPWHPINSNYLVYIVFSNLNLTLTLNINPTRTLTLTLTPSVYLGASNQGNCSSILYIQQSQP